MHVLRVYRAITMNCLRPCPYQHADVRDAALRRHMQRQLAGHARSMIFMAQDFVSTFCMEDERGCFTEEASER